MRRVLKTERLEIRPYEPGDEETLMDLLMDREIGKTYMLPEFHDREQARPLAKRLRELSFSAERYERGIYLEKKLIGFLNDVEIDGSRIEMGYVIHPAYWGHGYAAEAFSAVIADLFRRGFSEVIAGCFTGNDRSRRVMEKCGMKRLPREEDLVYRGKTLHCIYYGIEKDR